MVGGVVVLLVLITLPLYGKMIYSLSNMSIVCSIAPHAQLTDTFLWLAPLSLHLFNEHIVKAEKGKGVSGLGVRYSSRKLRELVTL